MKLNKYNFINLFANLKFLYLILFFWCFILRFPYIFIDEIAADENIFFILGDLILKNELPHDNYWDIKPALVWYIYSIPIFFFKHVVIIRLFGIIIIFLSAFFLFKIVYKIERNKFLAFVSSFLFIFASTFIGTELPNHSIGIGVNIITQHFANFFLIISIFFLFKNNSNINIFLVCFFFSLAILVRYNYALISLGYFYYYCTEKKQIKFFIIFSLTFFFSFLIIHCSYFTITRFQNLIEYFDVLEQYGSKSSFEEYIHIIKKFLRFIFEPLINFKIFNTRFYLSLFFWLSGLLFFILILVKEKKRDKIFLFINCTLMTMSILIGSPAEHYLLCVILFFSYFAAKTLDYFFLKKYRYIPIIIIFISSINSIKSEYLWLGARIINNENLNIGPGYDIYNYINKNNLPIKNNLYLSHPILYFLTDQKPIHKLIFPTQFNAHAKTLGGFDNAPELYKSLFKKKPRLLVFDENQWNIRANKDIYNIVKSEISENYEKIYKTRTTNLYIRR